MMFLQGFFYALEWVITWFIFCLLGVIYGIPLGLEAFLLICLLYGVFNLRALWSWVETHKGREKDNLILGESIGNVIALTLTYIGLQIYLHFWVM